VICSFPIRPYTAIMMELAKMVANGELDAEFLHVKANMPGFSGLGASAAGARAYTGSSGVGVTYAFEVYSPRRGSLPAPDGHRRQDARSSWGFWFRDTMPCRREIRVAHGLGGHPQKFSTILCSTTVWRRSTGHAPAVRLSRWILPVHIPDKVILPERSQVREFLPPYQAPHP